MTRVFTIGHGAHPLNDVTAALRAAGVAELADVRRYPGSRRHPQFGREALAAGLAGAGRPRGGRRPPGSGRGARAGGGAGAGTGPRHWPALGGRRSQPAGERRFSALTNEQFAAYAAHMTGEEWRDAFAALRTRAAE